MDSNDDAKVKVTYELRDSPNLAKLARALIRLAQAEAEKEAEVARLSTNDLGVDGDGFSNEDAA